MVTEWRIEPNVRLYVVAHATRAVHIAEHSYRPTTARNRWRGRFQAWPTPGDETEHSLCEFVAEFATRGRTGSGFVWG